MSVCTKYHGNPSNSYQNIHIQFSGFLLRDHRCLYWTIFCTSPFCRWSTCYTQQVKPLTCWWHYRRGQGIIRFHPLGVFMSKKYSIVIHPVVVIRSECWTNDCIEK